MANIVIVGAGPAGLIAAETLAGNGHNVTIYDRKPSAARKFLMAGRGGLNLTHSETLPQFMARYGAAADWLAPMINDFPPAALRAWCEGLGEETFVGSSGRVFPRSFKASPLLRAWQKRLGALGVRVVYGQRWVGLSAAEELLFVDDTGQETKVTADAALLALGGASWPRLGSDGGWVALLHAQGVVVRDLVPANCGFVVAWSPFVRDKYAGQPLKPVTLSYDGQSVRGEMMVTAKGLEGGAIYALSARLRDGIAQDGAAELRLDLRPDVGLDALTQKLAAPRGRDSFSNFLRKQTGLSPVAAAVLRDCAGDLAGLTAPALAEKIKNLPVRLSAPFDIDRAISSAGGIAREELDDGLMIKRMPGLFAAGEMIDWEAPTGGYLLQASFATGVRAAAGIDAFLKR